MHPSPVTSMHTLPIHSALQTHSDPALPPHAPLYGYIHTPHTTPHPTMHAPSQGGLCFYMPLVRVCLLPVLGLSWI